jgi:hypothetical protein
MADFAYDPEETLSFQGHDVSLRTAVHCYLETEEHPDSLVDFIAMRDAGKEPQVFEVEHFEALLNEPVFSNARNAGN